MSNVPTLPKEDLEFLKWTLYGAQLLGPVELTSETAERLRIVISRLQSALEVAVKQRDEWEHVHCQPEKYDAEIQSILTGESE